MSIVSQYQLQERKNNYSSNTQILQNQMIIIMILIWAFLIYGKLELVVKVHTRIKNNTVLGPM